MDPGLLKEHEKFRKRALANSSNLEKKSTSSSKTNLKYDPFKNKILDEYSTSTYNASITTSLNATSYSTHKFNILAKIVKHLKERFLNGYADFITLDEICDEMRLVDISLKIKQWLENEALPHNPKIKVSGVKSSNGTPRYMFKAPLDIRDKRSLLKLLAHRDENGLGAITMDQIEESLPNADKILKQIEGNAILLTRPGDKKRIIFHNDESCNFLVNPEFVRLWKNVIVEGVDETYIEQYLREKGMNAKKSQSSFPTDKVGKGRRRYNRTNKTHKPLSMKFNEHVAGVLKDYSVHKK